MYKVIVNEIYYLTKYANVSYSDCLRMSLLEKDYMLGFVQKDMKQTADKINEVTKGQ